MIAYAFKVARVSGSWWSRLIAWKTGGPFSHSELMLGGTFENALCFSSREGSGCSFRQVNLNEVRSFRVNGEVHSAPLWEIVGWPALTPVEEARILGFCEAMNVTNICYDYLALLGIVTEHGEHNDHDRFCSEVCVEVAQVCLGWWPAVRRWMVSPSGLRDLMRTV